MTESLDMYGRGVSFGKDVGWLQSGISLARAEAKEELEVSARHFEAEVATLSAESIVLKGKIAVLGERRQSQLKARSALEEDRLRASADFSVFKGVFYSITAVLLILADISVLGRVAAEFLGHDWRGGGRTFSQVLFSQPWVALRSFPDLFWLTIAVLLSGFFLKVWRDSWSSWDAEKGAWRRGGKADFILFSVLGAFALSSIVFMASARFTIDLSSSGEQSASSSFARLVAFALGLGLPLASAGFFIKGYDALSKRANLGALTIRCSRMDGEYWGLVKSAEENDLQIIWKKEEISRLRSSDTQRERAAAAEARFIEGYRVGLVSALAPDGRGVAALVRGRVLGRVLVP